MSTFNKIFKKKAYNDYENIASVGVNEDELIVFSPSSDKTTKGGLIPSPTKGQQNYIFSVSNGWNEFYIMGMEEGTEPYRIRTSLNNGNTYLPIPTDYMIDLDDYVHITEMAGGFKLPNNLNSHKIEDIIIGPVSQHYSTSTITSNTSSYQNLPCPRAISDDDITYSNMPSTKRIEEGDYLVIKNNLNLDKTKIDYNNSEGLIIAPFSTEKLVSITCRYSVNSSTRGNSVEIVPFINGERSAAQSAAFYSGGGWGETYIQTYVFSIPICTDSTNLTDATKILFKAKAYKGSPVVLFNDMNVSFLNREGMYWLVNKSNRRYTNRFV